MKQLLIFCLVFVGILVGMGASAQDSAQYFQAVVPVKSQSASDRKYATEKGMQQVLVRMSASEDVLKNEQVQKAVKRAQSFLEQYQFRRIEDEELKKKGYREEMNLVFSQELIQRLLSRAKVRYWPENNRPKILVWLVEDDVRYGKQLLNTASVDMEGRDHAVVSALNKAASERGLPLAYPLLDMDDQMAISAEDVWNLREEKLRPAAERYSAPVILVGRFSTTSRGELWSTWQYYYTSFNQTWDSRASELSKFANDALAPLNEFMADRWSILPRTDGNDSALVLHLVGVSSYKHFRQILDYLNDLAMISDVSVLEARQGELLVALKSEANLERFKTSVQLDKKIEFLPRQSDLPLWEQLPEGTRENPAHYRWLDT